MNDLSWTLLSEEALRLRYREILLRTYRYPAGGQKLDHGEFIQVIEVSLDEFRAHLRAGSLTDVETGYLCLDYLGKL